MNNEKWSFSLFGGFGYNFSNSKQHVLLNNTFDQETLQIISFENEIETESYNSFLGCMAFKPITHFIKNI